MQPEEQLIKQRLEKLKALEELNQNPYAHSYKKTHYSSQILEEFKKIKKEEKTKKKVSIAGRIISLRHMGKAAFGHILDSEGKIQYNIREDENPEVYKIFKKLDLGDIIGLEGTIFRTKMGEISIWCKNIQLLT